jgi:predicted ribosome quality control (RQC) complex YloA/Tae2 family protein
LLDKDGRIDAASKKPSNNEQSIGMAYKFPMQSDSQRYENDDVRFPELPDANTLSQILDKHYSHQEAQVDFDRLAAAARKKCRNELSKLRRLVKNLKSDLEEHGDAELWKRFGDLLLASQSTAVRKDRFILVNDLFQEKAPLIGIDADPKESVAEAAQTYFRKYAKARNASSEISSRLETIRKKIEAAESFREDIEAAVRSTDIGFFEQVAGRSTETKLPSKKVQVQSALKGIRTFTSSDGFEILVGKKAVDNDVLSFKVANSRDTWMHAADYPGSHVVIRNSDREEIPQKTLIEAAQLAAFYSQGNKQPKAAVHYTLKKFVNKPKRSSPGLVRLASFKTILVEPAFPNVSKK